MLGSRNSRHSWGVVVTPQSWEHRRKTLLHLLLNLLSLLHVLLLLHQALVFLILGLQVVAQHRLDYFSPINYGGFFKYVIDSDVQMRGM